MKTHALKLSLLAFLVLAAALLLYHRPVSFWTMTGTDPASIHSLSAHAVSGGVSNGVPYHDSYQLEATPAEDERVMEFFDLMAGSSYVPSLRNLLPWPIDSVSGGDKMSGNYTVHAAFTWGEEGEHFVTLSYLGAKKLALSLHNEPGYLVYYPTDREMVNRLGDFLKEHGITS